MFVAALRSFLLVLVSHTRLLVYSSLIDFSCEWKFVEQRKRDHDMEWIHIICMQNRLGRHCSRCRCLHFVLFLSLSSNPFHRSLFLRGKKCMANQPKRGRRFSSQEKDDKQILQRHDPSFCRDACVMFFCRNASCIIVIICLFHSFLSALLCISVSVSFRNVWFFCLFHHQFLSHFALYSMTYPCPSVHSFSLEYFRRWRKSVCRRSCFIWNNEGCKSFQAMQ
jgi:hypothetical protein